VPSADGDPGRASRGAETSLGVHRTRRGEKTPLGAVHRQPQQKAGEICGLHDAFKELGQLWRGKRPREEIALTVPAPEIEEAIELLLGLDALGHNLE
jgi:hypothetical protein